MKSLIIITAILLSFVSADWRNPVQGAYGASGNTTTWKPKTVPRSQQKPPEIWWVEKIRVKLFRVFYDRSEEGQHYSYDDPFTTPILMTTKWRIVKVLTYIIVYPFGLLIYWDVALIVLNTPYTLLSKMADYAEKEKRRLSQESGQS